MDGRELVRLYPLLHGFSTHAIGSRSVSSAGVGDVDGDGVADLALPDQTRRRVVVLRFGKTVETLMERELPSRVAGEIRIESDGRIAVPLENGELLELR